MVLSAAYQTVGKQQGAEEEKKTYQFRCLGAEVQRGIPSCSVLADRTARWGRGRQCSNVLRHAVERTVCVHRGIVELGKVGRPNAANEVRVPPRTHVKVVLARLVPRATTRVHGASLPQLCLVVVRSIQYVPVSVHARQSLGVSTAGLSVSVSGAVGAVSGGCMSVDSPVLAETDHSAFFELAIRKTRE